MNILLDFIPFQNAGGVGGATSFAKAISDEIIKRQTITKNLNLFAIYDSSIPPGRQYDYREYAETHHIYLLDIASAPLNEHINQQRIDVLLITIGQFYARYTLDNIKCKVIMFIHDLWDMERTDNKIDLIIKDSTTESKWQWAKRVLNVLTGRNNRKRNAIYNHIMPLYMAENTIAYTVSNYSRQSLYYYFPEINKKIDVCYSPIREVNILPSIENTQLQELINNHKPYLLLIAANRLFKNASTLIRVFKRIQKEHPDLHLLTLKYGKNIHSHHIDIPFLSDSDLEHAYKNAYALVFASFFEGFGYPPIEALRHGTPTIASNVTSIPEILGNAGIYFSPFYPADLYRALKEVLKDRNLKQAAMAQRLEEVTLRQREDLNRLVNQIVSGKD